MANLSTPKVYAQERDRERVKAYNAANHVVRYAKLRSDPVLWRAEKDRIRAIVARKRLRLHRLWHPRGPA